MLSYNDSESQRLKLVKQLQQEPELMQDENVFCSRQGNLGRNRMADAGDRRESDDRDCDSPDTVIYSGPTSPSESGANADDAVRCKFADCAVLCDDVSQLSLHYTAVHNDVIYLGPIDSDLNIWKLAGLKPFPSSGGPPLPYCFPTLIACPYPNCTRTLGTINSMRKHHQQMHGIRMLKTDIDALISLHGKPFQCTKCNSSYFKRQDLSFHIDKMHRNGSGTNLAVSPPKSMKLRQGRKRKDEKLVCPYSSCKKTTFKTLDERINHLATHHSVSSQPSSSYSQLSMSSK